VDQSVLLGTSVSESDGMMSLTASLIVDGKVNLVGPPTSITLPARVALPASVTVRARPVVTQQRGTAVSSCLRHESRSGSSPLDSKTDRAPLRS
jgi:hypothetical protein